MTKALEFRFPPDPEHLRSLRRDLRQKLEDRGVSVDVSDSVVLVVDEIVTNAIEHADPYRNENGRLLVRLEMSGADIVFDFEDPDVPGDVVDELATALLTWGDDHPPPEFERGRGLFLVAHAIDDLEVSRRSEGGLHLRGRFVGEIA